MNFATCYLVTMVLSIRLLNQVLMKLVYLMILLMTCDALTEIGSLKYLNMYLFFTSILGIMGKEYSFSDGRPGTALARARFGTTRQGTDTIGTAAHRVVADSATVPSWQPRHGPSRSETCHAVSFGPVALQCPCQPRR